MLKYMREALNEKREIEFYLEGVGGIGKRRVQVKKKRGEERKSRGKGNREKV